MDATIDTNAERPHLRVTLRRLGSSRGRAFLHSAAVVAGCGGALALAAWMVPAPTLASAPVPGSGLAGAAQAPLLGTGDALPLSLSEAEAANAALPVSSLPNPPARPFIFRGSADDQARALECLTAAIYYEAASEGEQGERAVAQVVLNRLRHPAFPKTVCGVVFEGAQRTDLACQFTFTCDGALVRQRARWAWEGAQRVAAEALAGYVVPEVGLATHYHTARVVPYWRDSLVKLAVIGDHIFYRWSGSAGLPAAFERRYAGGEKTIAALTGSEPEPDAAVAASAADAAQPVAVPQPQRPAPKLPGLAIDLSGMAEVEGGPRIIMPPKESATSAPTAVPLAAADAPGNAS